MRTWMSRGLALGMLLALFVGGAQPGAAGLIPPPWDKLAHAGYFFVLTLLFARGFALPIAWVAAVILLIGVADEWHQFFLPGRQAGMMDWMADCVGAMSAVWVLKVAEGRGSGLDRV